MSNNVIENQNSDKKSRRGLSKFGRLFVGPLFAITLIGVQTTPAEAYTASVDVQFGGICSDAYNIITEGGFSGGVRFNLGSHEDTYITLTIRQSWGWDRDDNGMNLPWVWNNQYHVRFLDSAGQDVWTEYDSIPNGGSQRYFVGSNVATILVAAGPGRNAYGYRMIPIIQAGVGYESE